MIIDYRVALVGDVELDIEVLVDRGIVGGSTTLAAKGGP